MTEAVTVTLKFPQGGGEPRDLELPTHVPIGTLAPILMDKLGWPVTAAAQYLLRVEETSTNIMPEQTLGMARVITGDVLILEQRLSVSLPSVYGSALVSSDGQIFPVREQKVLVGRVDAATGLARNRLAVDLAKLDPQRQVSRQHAQILVRADGVFIQDLRSANGTKLNGRRLTDGERVALRDGDWVEFGPVGLRFVRGAGNGG